jgi:hypothetical protein
MTSARTQRLLLLGALATLLTACAGADIPRLAATDAHTRVSSGQALLICAYGSEDKCRDRHLEGSISLTAFKAQVDTLPPDQELIFYCS